ncbi:MAG: hypothetical protein QG615_1770 [Nitrospirota bacterium]|nr:hypothetical protein [Nitrospirota bacterium]
MIHCEFKDQENNPCQNQTPCTIRCRECCKDVCSEHSAMGSKESVSEALFMQTVLCLTCAFSPGVKG